MKAKKPAIEKFEIVLLLSIFLVTTASIVVSMDLNSINPDEEIYLFIGKALSEGSYGEPGTYMYDYLHRLPLVPSLVSLSVLMGFGIAGARFFIPILFMNLLVFSTYIFTKTLYGKKGAIVSVLFVLTFPFFWRWGLSILTDIPIAAFSVLFLLLFYIGIEKEKKYLPLSALSLSNGLILKPSVLLFLVPAFLYLLLRKRLSLLKSKETIISIIIIPAVFFGVFYIYHRLFSATMLIDYQTTFFSSGWDISEIYQFALAPTLLLTCVGAIVALQAMRKQDKYVLMNGAVFISFFLYTGHLRLRYLAPLIPLMAALAAVGFFKLKEKTKITNSLLVILLFIAFVSSIFLIDLQNKTLWGVEELSRYVNGIEGEATIATEYFPHYLKASTSKNIVLLPEIVEFNGRKIDIEEFLKILSNGSQPEHSLAVEMVKSGNFSTSKPFEYSWFKENGVDYVILSIYSDYGRSGKSAYFHPAFGPFEVPFISRPYSNGRVPPDYAFSSDLYVQMESTDKYKMIKEIRNNEGQVIFLIYEVI